MSGYFQYFAFGLSGYIDRLLERVRAHVYRMFLLEMQPGATDTILDVGASADEHVSSNFLEKHYPHKSRICALSKGHHPELREQFHGIGLVRGDGRRLPFAARSFDFVYSHAVIEHVGSREQQRAFLSEAIRVARKGVFVTTPNRWHPMETHTGLPLLHFLPAALYRMLYRVLGKEMFAEEAELNLLTRRDLRALAGEVQAEVHGVRWLGLPSNLVLILRKRAETQY